jgi:hypothetical protein
VSVKVLDDPGVTAKGGVAERPKLCPWVPVGMLVHPFLTLISGVGAIPPVPWTWKV